MTEQKFTPRAVARLSVVETVYFQPQGDEAISVGSPYARTLDSDEQPYIRTLKIGEEWVDISQGSWLASGSALVIGNDEGKHQLIQRTPEERKIASLKVLEVAVLPLLDDDANMHTPEPVPIVFSLVHPGETIRIGGEELPKLRVRCRSGTAKCTISLFPT